MIRKILQATDPVLRQKSKTVKTLDKKTLGVIKDLKDTLSAQKDPEGVGLAAVQIGKLLKIFIANYENFDRVVINPEIISISPIPKKIHFDSRKAKQVMEGCLSLPNYYGPLKRSQSVKIKYQTPSSDDKSLITKTERFSGFHAQIILHEIDHLKGILFVDRLIKQGEPLYQLKGKDWQEVELI